MRCRVNLEKKGDIRHKMKTESHKKPQSIDEYIDPFPAEIAAKLVQMRRAIRQAAPKATEVISYGMPAFKQNRVLVYFAAAKKHLGFYPTSGPIEIFKKDLKSYNTSKGAVQFPLEKALPIALIKKIVRYRQAEDERLHQTTATAGFLATLGAPARRALQGKGITSEKKLAQYTEEEILSLHGLGPSSMPKLKAALKTVGLSFKSKK